MACGENGARDLPATRLHFPEHCARLVCHSPTLEPVVVVDLDRWERAQHVRALRRQETAKLGAFEAELHRIHQSIRVGVTSLAGLAEASA